VPPSDGPFDATDRTTPAARLVVVLAAALTVRLVGCW